MPKTRFSSLDVRAIATQLQNTIVGYRIANVYDINAKTYLLKLAKPDSKLFLLIESGVRVHLTQYARDKDKIPSNFSLKLRKHIRTRRVERVQQLGADRVLVLTCGTGEAEHHLVVELYDRGNLVLTDATHEILILLRNSKHDADAAVSVHDAYPISVKQELPTLSAAWLASQMQAAEPSTALRQLLTRCVPVGKEAVEHALTLSQLAPNTKMSARPWDDATKLAALLAALQDATESILVRKLCSLLVCRTKRHTSART